MSPKEVLEFAKKNHVKQLDLRFSDIPGLQHHVSYPITELTEDSFQEGFGMDGSSIRGWAAINESDMLLIPDPSTAFIDPVLRNPDSGDDLRRASTRSRARITIATRAGSRARPSCT